MKSLEFDFYKIGLAYCYEKGRGIEKSSEKAIEQYSDILIKMILTKENKSFLYYRIAKTILNSPHPQFAEYYFNLTINETLNNLRQKPLDTSLLFDLARMLIKGLSIKKDVELGN